MTEQTKACTKCGVEKVLSEFAPKSTGKDGLNSRCRQCVATYAAEWRASAALNANVSSSGLKRCGKCGEQKPVAEFRAKKCTKDGLDYACRACRSEATPVKQPQEGYKFCGDCGEEKELSEFHKHSMGAFGRESICRACKKVRDAKRYASQADGITVRHGCMSPNECSSISHKLCRSCVQMTPDLRRLHSEKMRIQASAKEWRLAAASRNQDVQYLERIRAAIQKYWDNRRENEAYEVFMARIEEEEASFIRPVQLIGEDE